MRGTIILIAVGVATALAVIAFVQVNSCKALQHFSFKNDGDDVVHVTPIAGQRWQTTAAVRSSFLRAGFAVGPGDRLGLSVPYAVVVDAAIVEYPDGDVRVIAAEPWKVAGDNVIGARESQRSASAEERAAVGIAPMLHLAPFAIAFVAQPLNFNLIRRLL